MTMKYIGQSVPRVDALAKVKGEAVYASDMTLPGQTYMKVLLAHRPHALVKRRHRGRAEALPGASGDQPAEPRRAVERGGALVRIDDAGEQQAVWDAIVNGAGVPVNYTVVGDGGGIAYVWIGATDKVTEGTWTWDGVDGGNGDNFWTGQGTNGSGNRTPVGGLYNNWGGSSAGAPKEPDNYNNQDGAAIGLAGWPSGSGALGIAGEWNDINLSNTLYFVVEYNQTGLSGKVQEPVVVSPNPAKEQLIITSRLSGPGMAEVQLITRDGRVALHRKGTLGGRVSLDLAGIPSGVCLVVVVMDGGSRHYLKAMID